MIVKDAAKKRVAMCRPDTNLADAAALMWDNKCGVLPVVGESGELSGIVTDRDICIALGTRNIRPSDLYIRDVIKNHTLVFASSDDIRSALQEMRRDAVTH
jgi:CBS domain-containing protein